MVGEAAGRASLGAPDAGGGVALAGADVEAGLAVDGAAKTTPPKASTVMIAWSSSEVS